MSNGQDGNPIMPRHIVVAVTNTDRMRDLSPTASAHEWDGKRFPAPIGGNGAEFLKFLVDELIPQIDGTYRAMDFRTITGHSLGGLFSLYAAMERPDIFNAAVAIDPSLWWDEKSLLSEAESRFGDSNRQSQSIYIASANNPGSTMLADAQAFHSMLEGSESARIRSRADYFASENHGSVPLLGLYQGLSFVFEGYQALVREALENPAELRAGLEQLSRRLGATFVPPELLLVNTAQDVVEFRDSIDEARELLELAVDLYPTSANSRLNLASICVDTGDVGCARLQLQAVLQMEPASEFTRSLLRSVQERAAR